MDFLDHNVGVSYTTANSGYFDRMYKHSSNTCLVSDPDSYGGSMGYGASVSKGGNATITNADNINQLSGISKNTDITLLFLNVQYAIGYDSDGNFIHSLTIGTGFGLSYANYETNSRVLINKNF